MHRSIMLAGTLIVAAAWPLAAQQAGACPKGREFPFQGNGHSITEGDSTIMLRVDSVARRLGYIRVNRPTHRATSVFEARSQWPIGLEGSFSEIRTGWAGHPFPGVRLTVGLDRFNGILELSVQGELICPPADTGRAVDDRVAQLEGLAAFQFKDALFPPRRKASPNTGGEKAHE
jgi:hypothetical protein